MTPPSPSTPRSVLVLSVSLLALGVAGGLVARGPIGSGWLLVPLAVALGLAESLQVEFTYGSDVRAVDVVEAVLAPVLLLFAGPVAVLLAVTSKVVSQQRLGVERTKVIFNVSQWAAAVAVASLVYRGLAGGQAGEVSSLPALIGGLLAFAVTNELAVAVVLCIVRDASPTRVIADLAPGFLPHTVIWSMNAALGVLFAVAVASSPITAVLLLAPLGFVHWAHRAFLGMRADHARLDGLARAVAGLAAPIDPREALGGFLDDVRAAFSSAAVELVTFGDGRVLRSGAPAISDDLAIEAARNLVARGQLRRARVTDADLDTAADLVAAGRSDALAAPIIRDGSVVGALVSYDRTGFEGFEAGEEAVMTALAAAASRAIEKSELLADVVEERRKLGDIVDRSSDGILTLSEEGLIESWNPAMEAMTGIAANDMIGTARLSRLKPRDAGGARVYFEDWPDDGVPDEVLITTTDGGERWLGCSSSVGAGGHTLIVVARDITRAREIDQMRDDFVATVSHELRTPLATIRGFTELLDPPGSVSVDVQAEALARIRRGTHRLERLVANLLEVSRIDSNRSPDVIRTELDVCDVVSRVVDEVRESWPDRTIRVDTGSDSRSWIAHGSMLSTERILINLLSNALSYADAGPVDVIVSGDAGAGVAITVRDEGPGIPAGDLDRVFERFERLDTANHKAGTGLGLYISRGLAQSMDAALTVESTVGQGAAFTLHLTTVESAPSKGLIDLRS